MFSWLLMIFMISLSVTLGEFPSRFLKCSFHICICFSWLVAFSSQGALPFAHFIYCLPCYSRFSIFYQVSNVIDLTLNVFYLFFLVCIMCSCMHTMSMLCSVVDPVSSGRWPILFKVLILSVTMCTVLLHLSNFSLDLSSDADFSIAGTRAPTSIECASCFFM